MSASPGLMRPRRALYEPQRRLWIWCGLVGVVVMAWVAPGIGARASEGGQVTGDEPHYLMTAISLGEDGNLDIADERAESRYRDFHEQALPPQSAVRDDGSRISPHDPLLPAFLAVPVLLGGWVGAKVAMALLAGLLAATLVWVAVRRFAVSAPLAALVVLVFCLAPPVSVYATQIYPELPAALLVALAVAALTGPMRRAGVAGLGAAVVALPWLSAKYTPVAVALAAVGLLLLVRRADRDDRRRAAWLGGGLALSAVVFLFAHQLLYGGWTAYSSGLHFTDGEFSVVGTDPDYVGRSVRATGLLFDRSFGLVPWQPAYLLAVPALAALVRRRPQGWVALGAPLAVGWLTAVFVALTMHGWSWPGRQVVVVLPLLVLAVASWAGHLARASATRLRRRSSPPALGALSALPRLGRRRVPALLFLGFGVALVVGAVSTVWVFAEVVTGSSTLVVDFESTTQPVVRALHGVLPDYRNLGGAGEMRHVAVLAACVALAVSGWRSVDRPPAISRNTTTKCSTRKGDRKCPDHDESQLSLQLLPPRPSSWERAAATTEATSAPSATTPAPSR